MYKLFYPQESGNKAGPIVWTYYHLLPVVCFVILACNSDFHTVLWATVEGEFETVCDRQTLEGKRLSGVSG